MATFLSVDSICTDADLANQVGGADELNRINPATAQRDIFRASALDDVVNALASRAPPVRDFDLSVPGELKMAVCYRALSKIYNNEITQAGDRNHVIAKDFQEQYQAAMRASFSVPCGQTSPSGGSRRMARR